MVNCRCVAIARFSFVSDAAVASAEMVGIGSVFKAIDLRRFKSGSVRAESTSAMVTALIYDPDVSSVVRILCRTDVQGG